MKTQQLESNDKKIMDMIREFQIEQSKLAEKENSYDELEIRFHTLIEKIRELKIKTTKSSSKSFLVDEARSRGSSIMPNINTNYSWLSYYNFDMYGGETLVDQAIYISSDTKDEKRAIQRLYKIIEEKEPRFLRQYGDEE